MKKEIIRQIYIRNRIWIQSGFSNGYYQSGLESNEYNIYHQEKIRGQRGTLPDQALGYVKFGKVIFRRPFATEV